MTGFEVDLPRRTMRRGLKKTASIWFFLGFWDDCYLWEPLPPRLRVLFFVETQRPKLGFFLSRFAAMLARQHVCFKHCGKKERGEVIFHVLRSSRFQLWLSNPPERVEETTAHHPQNTWLLDRYFLFRRRSKADSPRERFSSMALTYAKTSIGNAHGGTGTIGMIINPTIFAHRKSAPRAGHLFTRTVISGVE